MLADRPYQIDGIARVREAFRKHRRVLMVLPTGGGKTVMAAEILRSAAAKGRTGLFLAHRLELIEQAADKLERFGVPHGIVMAGFRPSPEHPVQVASIMSLARRMKPPADLIVIDEAHRARAATYSEILSHYPQARVLGITATPWRLDGKGLAGAFDEVVVVETPRGLTDLGWICGFRGFKFDAPDLSRVRIKRGDFDAKQLAADAESNAPKRAGDIVGKYLEHCSGPMVPGGKVLYPESMRALVFAVSIADSKRLVEAFVAAGFAAEHLDGEMPRGERQAVIQRVREGRTRVLVNRDVATEGLDIPEIELVVLGRATASRALFNQMVGRGARPIPCECGIVFDPRLPACPKCGEAPRKIKYRIHDHSGNLDRHGLPTDPADYSLTADVNTRKVRDGGGPPCCPACRELWTPPNCQGCGYKREVAAVEVETVAATETIVDDSHAVAPASSEERQQYLRSAMLAAWKRGHKSGRAWHQYRERFGIEPDRAAWRDATSWCEARMSAEERERRRRAFEERSATRIATDAADAFFANVGPGARPASVDRNPTHGARRSTDPDRIALGIDDDAPFLEARSAYRRLVHQHHPDKGGDAEKFRQIVDAWRRLEPKLLPTATGAGSSCAD